MDRSVPRKSNTLLLNFKSHCLSCLQHEDPAVLHKNASENPRNLDFQSILPYLTGNPLGSNIERWGTLRQFYPVVTNLPPLCQLCYGILAELSLFHCELLELQRKIQNQTEAARRIVSGTTRKRGGMRKEFFNRLKIGGIHDGDMKAMESFLGNFHELVLEADQKPVFPKVTPLAFDNSISSCQRAMQTYNVEFVVPKPMASSSNTAFSTTPPYPAQIAQPGMIEGSPNAEIDLVTTPSSPPNRAVLVERISRKDLEELYEKLDAKIDDDVVILENESVKSPAEVIDVVDEDNYENAKSSNKEEEGEDELEDDFEIEYSEYTLPSSLIIEPVEEEQDEKPKVEETVHELIEEDDDDDDVNGKDQRSPSTVEVLPQQRITLSLRKQKKRATPATATSSKKRKRLAKNRPKPFKCGYVACKKGFANKMTREQHERIHTGERPCVCEVCGSTFRQNSTLYRHKKIHEKGQGRRAR